MNGIRRAYCSGDKNVLVRYVCIPLLIGQALGRIIDAIMVSMVPNQITIYKPRDSRRSKL